MPIYEYKCESCSAVLEKLQKLSDPVLVECPECGNYTLVKLVSAPSFRLKGSGWYETDFKTGKKKNGAGEDSSGGSSGGSSGESGESGEGKSAGKGSDKGSDKTTETNPGKSSASTGSAAPGTSSTAGTSAD